jgi:nicotinamidase-related amidase
MNTISPTSCALVLVDYQQRLMPALHDGQAALARAVWLADVARCLRIHVVGTEENPAGLGPNVEAIRSRCEPTIAKQHFDACADGLLDVLRSPRAAQTRPAPQAGSRGPAEPDPLERAGGHLPADIVFAGCEAHVCLMQTVLGALRHGLRCWVVADACASRRPHDRELGLQRLRSAGATLVSAEMVAFEWLRTSAHPRFGELLERLKTGPAV